MVQLGDVHNIKFIRMLFISSVTLALLAFPHVQIGLHFQWEATSAFLQANGTRDERAPLDSERYDKAIASQFRRMFRLS
jgi:hypothetical protein